LPGIRWGNTKNKQGDRLVLQSRPQGGPKKKKGKKEGGGAEWAKLGKHKGTSSKKKRTVKGDRGNSSRRSAQSAICHRGNYGGTKTTRGKKILPHKTLEDKGKNSVLRCGKRTQKAKGTTTTWRREEKRKCQVRGVRRALQKKPGARRTVGNAQKVVSCGVSGLGGWNKGKDITVRRQNDFRENAQK